MTVLLTSQELEAKLRQIGAERYHRLHPFHRLLHDGKCSKSQVQAWALNRYYYQAMIPIKDARLIGRCEDPAVRREWRSRLVGLGAGFRLNVFICSAPKNSYSVSATTFDRKAQILGGVLSWAWHLRENRLFIRGCGALT